MNTILAFLHVFQTFSDFVSILEKNASRLGSSFPIGKQLPDQEAKSLPDQEATSRSGSASRSGSRFPIYLKSRTAYLVLGPLSTLALTSLLGTYNLKFR